MSMRARSNRCCMRVELGLVNAEGGADKGEERMTKNSRKKRGARNCQSMQNGPKYQQTSKENGRTPYIPKGIRRFRLIFSIFCGLTLLVIVESKLAVIMQASPFRRQQWVQQEASLKGD